MCAKLCGIRGRARVKFRLHQPVLLARERAFVWRTRTPHRVIELPNTRTGKVSPRIILFLVCTQTFSRFQGTHAPPSHGVRVLDSTTERPIVVQPLRACAVYNLQLCVVNSMSFRTERNHLLHCTYDAAGAQVRSCCAATTALFCRRFVPHAKNADPRQILTRFSLTKVQEIDRKHGERPNRRTPDSN
jgi:hypothetical protein